MAQAEARPIAAVIATRITAGQGTGREAEQNPGTGHVCKHRQRTVEGTVQRHQPGTVSRPGPRPEKPTRHSRDQRTVQRPRRASGKGTTATSQHSKRHEPSPTSGVIAEPRIRRINGLLIRQAILRLNPPLTRRLNRRPNPRFTPAANRRTIRQLRRRLALQLIPPTTLPIIPPFTRQFIPQFIR